MQEGILGMIHRDLGGGKHLIVLKKGEEIMESLERFSEENNVQSGSFKGIGALNPVEIGYFDTEGKEYEFKEFDDGYELLNLQGNITWKEEGVIIHAHVVLGDEEHNAFGGHLKKGVVSVTCEIFLEEFKEKIERELDEETKLSLIT